MGVIIIPRKNIMGKVDERAFKTLVILISASLCILFIGCICIFILTNGVSKEMKLRAELISHLDARRRAEASSNYKSQFLANMRSVNSAFRIYGYVILYYEANRFNNKIFMLQS